MTQDTSLEDDEEPIPANDNKRQSGLLWYQEQNPMEFFASGKQLDIEDYIDWLSKRERDIDV